MKKTKTDVSPNAAKKINADRFEVKELKKKRTPAHRILAPELKYDRMCEVLYECIEYTDDTIASKYKIHPATIKNYRKALKQDYRFCEYFQNYKKIRNSDWGLKLKDILANAIEKAHESINAQDMTNPSSLKAITEAIKQLSEIDITKRLIDDRYFSKNRKPDETITEIGTTGDSETDESADEVKDLSDSIEQVLKDFESKMEL